jgi:DNA-binding NtrC family response regulator
MPGLNGTELLRKMKETNKQVRTILMTAFEIEDTIFSDYTKNEIINGFFQKPVRIFDLIKEVNTQLHSYEIQSILLYLRHKLQFYTSYQFTPNLKF